MEKNEAKQDILKIKNEVLGIISENISGSLCLCGHSEWCDVCSSSSNYNKLIKELREYLSKI